jgi:hypothetical protein
MYLHGSVHSEAPGLEYQPGLHGAHEEAFSFENVPCGHSAHVAIEVAAFTDELVPAGQCMHSTASTLEYVPTGQGT